MAMAVESRESRVVRRGSRVESQESIHVLARKYYRCGILKRSPLCAPILLISLVFSFSTMVNLFAYVVENKISYCLSTVNLDLKMASNNNNNNNTEPVINRDWLGVITKADINSPLEMLKEKPLSYLGAIA